MPRRLTVRAWPAWLMPEDEHQSHGLGRPPTLSCGARWPMSGEHAAASSSASLSDFTDRDMGQQHPAALAGLP
jgi:hypothetical protein